MAVHGIIGFQAAAQCSESEEPAAKIRLVKSFSEMCDIVDSKAYDKDGINEYLRAESLSTCSESERLEFWKGEQCNYLSPCTPARKVLAIPATIKHTSSKRNFSEAGSMMQE
ncbi:hypothetical protein HPB50_000860 [Hyalomma asiaticum]|uniref:Uncharacterized protein n=1 Tax=Hyalomma asiaticum TaxID=266040 RepID=A0ACB7SF77_HYAAI|nr:hypothetical protein HPB50_000860 [Hyalomma asiaticum]